MSDQERLARAYCESLDLDPEEEVLGVLQLDQKPGTERIFFHIPRWRWYTGARP